MQLEENWDRTKYFLAVYVSMAAVNTVFTLARAFLFAYGGVVAAKDLHGRLLHRVFTSTMLWWDQSPWGRVLNRLGNGMQLPLAVECCSFRRVHRGRLPPLPTQHLPGVNREPGRCVDSVTDRASIPGTGHDHSLCNLLRNPGTAKHTFTLV